MQIKTNLKIYPLEAVLNACYAFIDRAYIHCDTLGRGDIVMIDLKPKKGLTRSQKRSLADEFNNELLHSALRYQISKNNKKIREYIIGRAICSPPDASSMSPDASKQEDYLKDPLGIAIPWEKRYGKKRKRALKV